MRERLARPRRRGYGGSASTQTRPRSWPTSRSRCCCRRLDHLWREHLVTLDHLRQVIGLRGYAQRDPLNEYKTEAFELFDELDRAACARRSRASSCASRSCSSSRRAGTAAADEAHAPRPDRPARTRSALAGRGSRPPSRSARRTIAERRAAERDPSDPSTWGRVGRNEPCPCGSGKKYKHCHGRYRLTAAGLCARASRRSAAEKPPIAASMRRGDRFAAREPRGRRHDRRRALDQAAGRTRPAVRHRRDGVRLRHGAVTAPTEAGCGLAWEAAGPSRGAAREPAAGDGGGARRLGGLELAKPLSRRPSAAGTGLRSSAEATGCRRTAEAATTGAGFCDSESRRRDGGPAAWRASRPRHLDGGRRLWRQPASASAVDGFCCGLRAARPSDFARALRRSLGAAESPECGAAAAAAKRSIAACAGVAATDASPGTPGAGRRRRRRAAPAARPWRRARRPACSSSARFGRRPDRPGAQLPRPRRRRRTRSACAQTRDLRLLPGDLEMSEPSFSFRQNAMFGSARCLARFSAVIRNG